MIAFLIVLGWLICSVLAYLLGKFLWIRHMKNFLRFIPCWTEENRLVYIFFSIFFGPFTLISLLIIGLIDILKSFLIKIIGCSPDKPAKW